jgi:putative ABC transport system permease protein
VQYGTKSSSFSVNGEYPSYPAVQAVDLTGGALSTSPTSGAAQGGRYRQPGGGGAFRQPNPMGQQINIKGIYFRVVGLFKGEGKPEERPGRTPKPFLFRSLPCKWPSTR